MDMGKAGTGCGQETREETRISITSMTRVFKIYCIKLNILENQYSKERTMCNSSHIFCRS